ncbi:MAG: hypothetical protein GY804_07475 [Alphaproteobacteria bacterium]|nr:hypothetical protein [Alphaproteobacteria bacterium]
MSCSIYKIVTENNSANNLADETICLGVCAKHHIREFFKAQDENFLATGVYKHVIGEVERSLIEVVLEITEGNKLQASKILGLNRNTLRKKISDLGIEEEQFNPKK